jgi:hypothetical protein
MVKKITGGSFLLVKKFNVSLKIKGFRGKPFGKRSLPIILEDYVRNCGLTKIDQSY